MGPESGVRVATVPFVRTSAALRAPWVPGVSSEHGDAAMCLLGREGPLVTFIEAFSDERRR